MGYFTLPLSAIHFPTEVNSGEEFRFGISLEAHTGSAIIKYEEVDGSGVALPTVHWQINDDHGPLIAGIIRSAGNVGTERDKIFKFGLIDNFPQIEYLVNNPVPQATEIVGINLHLYLWYTLWVDGAKYDHQETFNWTWNVKVIVPTPSIDPAQCTGLTPFHSLTDPIDISLWWTSSVVPINDPNKESSILDYIDIEAFAGQRQRVWSGSISGIEPNGHLQSLHFDSIANLLPNLNLPQSHYGLNIYCGYVFTGYIKQMYPKPSVPYIRYNETVIQWPVVIIPPNPMFLGSACVLPPDPVLMDQTFPLLLYITNEGYYGAIYLDVACGSVVTPLDTWVMEAQTAVTFSKSFKITDIPGVLPLSRSQPITITFNVGWIDAAGTKHFTYSLPVTVQVTANPIGVFDITKSIQLPIQYSVYANLSVDLYMANLGTSGYIYLDLDSPLGLREIGRWLVNEGQGHLWPSGSIKITDLAGPIAIPGDIDLKFIELEFICGHVDSDGNKIADDTLSQPINVLIPQTGLTVTTSPIFGEVFLDGISQGISPVTLVIAAGSCTISFGDVEGYTTPQDIQVTLSEGEQKSVNGTYVGITSPPGEKFPWSFGGALIIAGVAVIAITKHRR